MHTVTDTYNARYPPRPTTALCAALQGNQLGQAFAETAELVGAQSWHDLFDTSVMEIAHADVARFKTELIRLAGQLLS